jgi:hypothetical protein
MFNKIFFEQKGNKAAILDVITLFAFTAVRQRVSQPSRPSIGRESKAARANFVRKIAFD